MMMMMMMMMMMKRDDDDDGVYLKAVSCEFLNLQIIQIICKCEVMM